MRAFYCQPGASKVAGGDDFAVLRFGTVVRHVHPRSYELYSAGSFRFDCRSSVRSVGSMALSLGRPEASLERIISAMDATGTTRPSRLHVGVARPKRRAMERGG